MSVSFAASGPEEPPLLGPAPHPRRDRLGALMHAAQQLGDVAHLRYGKHEFYLFVHPDAIQHILVTKHRNYPKGPDQVYLKPVIGEGVITSEGSLHLRQRRMLQPAFHRGRIGAYATVMTTYTTEMLDRWRPGTTIDLAHEMLQLTLRIVLRTLVGADIDDPADPVGRALNAALSGVDERPRTMLPNTRRSLRGLDDVIYRLIRERRAAGTDTGDILSLLLAADGAMPGEDARALSDRQVRDEVMTLFFAGFETAASSLSWAWSLLAEHPEVDRALHAEAVAVLGGRPPTVDDVPRLRYTTMIFAETMRLFPPIWSITRQAVAEDYVGGYQVPAGAPVMISPYVTQRDPRFFAAPDQFNPERFHPDHDVRKHGPRYAYVPFGAGSRQCMGESYAWMEGALLLSMVAQRYRVHLVPGRPVVPQAMITLRPKDGVHVTLEAR